MLEFCSFHGSYVACEQTDVENNFCFEDAVHTLNKFAITYYSISEEPSDSSTQFLIMLKNTWLCDIATANIKIIIAVSY